MALEMGWFWNKTQDSNNNDVVKNLDPSLKDFLQTEAPKKFEQPKTAPPPVVEPTPAPKEHHDDEKKPLVPAESLYQDGRYAHLWKGYTPLSVIEATGKTDQEQLAELVDGYTMRETQLNRAAQENCIFEWLAQSECLKSGGFKDKFTMCSKESAVLNRCFLTQGKMMKALGYINPQGRTVERMEDIQIHADRLYRNMLEQEKAVEEAKEKGLPIPEFPPVIANSRMKRIALGQAKPLEKSDDADLTEYEWKTLPKDRMISYKQRLQGLAGVERELEVEALRGEMEAARALSHELIAVQKAESESRHAREAAGQATIGDRIKKLTGWN
ncbi:hypothetical protein EJ05DRAFT_503591 [Pseudovirgaria hyperparasitica]|uniref:Uncharacterized protein n=1 Tax=Pseudovirgaria hyperparasitica TaxID=470096 RepID=A0A6A6W134_9PEZI|nr:uncharacterized protein EJ05DRAFT_503591 [Pseudovirgaria hyperparasitica]KAF2755287.1 hypothetical protein EJ05DRAFT_503591 [Pseudovirgaria hyperparasitica]